MPRSLNEWHQQLLAIAFSAEHKLSPSPDSVSLWFACYNIDFSSVQKKQIRDTSLLNIIFSSLASSWRVSKEYSC